MADNAANITKAFKKTLLQAITPDWTSLSKVYDTSEEDFPVEELSSDVDEDETSDLRGDCLANSLCTFLCILKFFILNL